MPPQGPQASGDGLGSDREIAKATELMTNPDKGGRRLYKIFPPTGKRKTTAEFNLSSAES